MKKKFIMAFGLLAAAMLTGCFGSSQNTPSQPVATPEKELISSGNDEVKPEGQQDDGKTLVDTGADSETKPSVVVKSGYEFTIPEDIGVNFADEVGLYVYMNDIFQLRPVVVKEDKSKFDSYYTDCSVLTEKSVAAGGSITHEPKLDTVDGIDIFHFRVDFGEEICEVMRCSLSDTESLGANMVLFSDLSENDCLHVFASIAKTAKPTDAEDTTLASYIDANTSIHTGEELSENKIGDGKKTVSYNVTPGFLYKPEYDESDDDMCEQSYGDDKFNFLLIKLCNDGEDANAYVSARSNDVKTMDVNGYTYYYCLEDESTDEYTCFSSVAATDVGDGYVYVVDFEAMYEYKAEDLIEFMQIKVK